MKNKNWQQVESIFHTALCLTGKERDSYLFEACSADDSLLKEVESLIFAFERESRFLEQPAFSLGMSVLQRDLADGLSNKKIGCYQVKKRLGCGGMGDVYLAEDTRLNREVALKFLTGSFVDDKWAKRQLNKEAQAVAMLDHPNICGVHGIEEIDKHNFIVMQYIDGATLAEFIGHRQLSLEDILSIAHQIVSAVAVAHSHGIIHRDIKPGNIMITGNGQVKVLDFGLAKIVQQKQKAERVEENTSQISNNGLILGTVSYMSPEQLRAEKLDYRSDIFSVGIVLYELLGRQNPFNRKSQAEVIAAILSSEPTPLNEVGSQVPESLDSIVRKCLKKDKEKRFQSAVELQVELDNFKNGIKINSPQKLTGSRNYAVLALLLLLISSIFFFYSGSAAKVHAFAILPIVNESNNADNDYLSDGLTDSLINRMSHLTKLRVKAPTVVSRYKGQKIDPQKVGSELNVEALLIGKIVRRGDSALLQVSLINTADEAQIWGGEYKIEGTDLVTSQEEISTQIASNLQIVLSKDEKDLLTKQQTADPGAAREYFQGRYYWNKRDRDNILRAIKHFEKAIDLDPTFARAWAGLADSYALLNVPAYGSLTSKEAAIKAKDAATKALELDETLCEAYTSLGIVKLRYEWNWEGAEENFRKAIEIRSDYAPSHFWYSNLLIVKGQFEKALEEGRKARELDPLYPNYDINIGRIMYFQRENDKAVQIFTEILENNPQNANAAYLLGFTYLQQGSNNEAVSILEQFYKTNKSYFAAPLGYAYGRVGRSTDALKVLTELEAEKRSKREYLPPQEEAIIYIGLNNKDKVFEKLNQSCQERFSSFPFLLKE